MAGTREKSIARLQRLAKEGHPLAGGKRMTKAGKVEYEHVKNRVKPKRKVKAMDYEQLKALEKKLKPKIKLGPLKRVKPLKKKVNKEREV